MNEFAKNSAESLKKLTEKAFWVGTLTSAGIGVLIVFLSTTFFQEYGLVLFVLGPVLIGALPALIGGNIALLSLQEAIKAGFVALGITALALIAVALEGVICLIMASPIASVLGLLGAYGGYWIRKELAQYQQTTLLALAFLVIPVGLVFEKQHEWDREVIPVTTSIVIDASPEVVWENVVSFSELPQPEELLFKTGIAYPVRARIVGRGEGAVRYCDFSTGSFVEPITTWKEGELLAFSVEDQPVPMKELSPYGEIDPAHLHGYFVSVRGEFKLTEIAPGRTLLEGTTWYYQKLRPQFYWNFWSDYIIHSIHGRVLSHIKNLSENGGTE
ncbi:MAG: SRPBCC family protein [Candidatus Kapaibacterium sp.]